MKGFSDFQPDKVRFHVVLYLGQGGNKKTAGVAVFILAIALSNAYEVS